MIAAGGGGDAIAAAALAAWAPGGAVAVATLAWDRLMIDPLPGPRAASNFANLQQHHGWAQVTAQSRPIPPAGSTLPRLAADLPIPLILLDPTSGARGMRQQIHAAATELDAHTIRIVDVGGDLLGQPGDTGLRSPLADALTAASCIGLPADAWIAGPGLDGELDEALVLQRTEGADVRTLDETLWAPWLPILQWHPSEATALLAAASLGVRGTVEIRDAGLPVTLTDHSATAIELSLQAVSAINPTLRALTDTATFEEAELAANAVLGHTELSNERAKAARPRPPLTASTSDQLAGLGAFEAAARARGAHYVTYRRIAEALGHHDTAAVRRQLTSRRPLSGPALLWDLTAQDEVP